MNKEIINYINTLPKDGTYKYEWERGQALGDGTTRTINYKGTNIVKVDKNLNTYCCGIAFEAYLVPALTLGIDFGTFRELQSIKADFYVNSRERLRGAVDALVPRGLAVEITNLNEAKAGDIVQLWRKNPTVTDELKMVGPKKYTSGHSVIFLEAVNKGFKYFSTQKITNGIGERTEYFTGINPLIDVFIARPLYKK